MVDYVVRNIALYLANYAANYLQEYRAKYIRKYNTKYGVNYGVEYGTKYLRLSIKIYQTNIVLAHYHHGFDQLHYYILLDKRLDISFHC